MLIDTHCHLTFPDFEGRVDAALADGAKAGVGGAITISTTTLDCLRALEVAKSHERVWCSAGVHPLYSDEGPHEWANVRIVALHPRCVAFGELGLDNHYPEPDKAVQLRVLEEQLHHIERWRREDGLDKPIILHCREAFAELIPILKRTTIPGERFVFHCFTGGPPEMRMLLDFGAFVSFTGVLTYKNAREVQEAARLVPAGRFMVETDAPFLTPDPHRGVRPNEPKYVRVVAEFLARLRGERWEEFERSVNETTRGFFGVD